MRRLDSRTPEHNTRRAPGIVFGRAGIQRSRQPRQAGLFVVSAVRELREALLPNPGSHCQLFVLAKWYKDEGSWNRS